MTDHDEPVPGPAPGVPTRPARPGRSLRKRAPTAAPAARFEPGRVAETRHRNPTWIVAGVLLVVLSALGGVVLFTSSDDRTEVLVAAKGLQPGQAVERGDLRIERVALDNGVASVPADAADSVVGQHPIGQIPAGTMLAPAMFEAAVPLGPDEVVVGAALDPGEAPLQQLEVGTSVELLRVPVAGPNAATPPSTPEGASEAQTLGTGTVWSVDQIATGQLWVSVRVDRAVGMAVSEASAADQLRLALIGGTG